MVDGDEGGGWGDYGVEERGKELWGLRGGVVEGVEED